MNKTAFDIVNESFEKVAARAWKKKLGELGEESVNKLLSSGVFNRTKELKGLNLGSNKIINKYNGKNINNINKATSHYLETAKHLDPSFSHTSPDYGATRDMIKNMRIFGSPQAAHSKWGKSALLNVPRKRAHRETNKLLANTANQYKDYGIDISIPDKLKRNDREGKKWVNAIALRHEADEIRHGSKVLKNKKLMVDLGGGQQRALTAMGSHITPKVLVSEASNLALAPKSTKNYFSKMRSIGIDGTSDKDVLKEYAKFNYDKSSGVYNKAIARKGERAVSRASREAYGI